MCYYKYQIESGRIQAPVQLVFDKYRNLDWLFSLSPNQRIKIPTQTFNDNNADNNSDNNNNNNNNNDNNNRNKNGNDIDKVNATNPTNATENRVMRNNSKQEATRTDIDDPIRFTVYDRFNLFYGGWLYFELAVNATMHVDIDNKIIEFQAFSQGTEIYHKITFEEYTCDDEDDSNKANGDNDNVVRRKDCKIIDYVEIRKVSFAFALGSFVKNTAYKSHSVTMKRVEKFFCDAAASTAGL